MPPLDYLFDDFIPHGRFNMEQIETQVSDLRYLAQAPIALGATTTGSSASTAVATGAAMVDTSAGAASLSYETPQHPSPGSASIGDNSAQSSNKRKSMDEGTSIGKQTRSKRNRYISIACNECKRRKIKCNGETPCQRCGNLNLTCLYAPNCCSNNFKDTDDFKEVLSNLGRLQDEVAWLHQTVKTLQSDPSRLGDRAPHLGTSTIAPSPSQSSTSLNNRHDFGPQRGPISFRGPTSMAYSLDVANATISNMGYRGLGDGDDVPIPIQPPDMMGPIPTVEGPGDPLLEFDKDEIIRLCRVHEEEIGIMYPVTSIQGVIEHAKNLVAFLESVKGQRPMSEINDAKTLKLKMIMCCALVVEGHGHSEKAVRLYESMENIVNRMLMADAADVTTVPLLALLAGYRFLSNDEILAWRVMGQVARLSLELGIHQRAGLMKIQSEEERQNALVSFWTAYVLDRRWAFGTGLPYVVQDEEIDPQLPFPNEYPYLVAMITYSRLGAKIWRQVANFVPILARELQQAEIDNLDQEILNWYDIVPEEVKVRHWTKEKRMTSTPSYNLQRLRIWTYLRLNQMRIWLYTPVLYSATSIISNPIQSQRVVDLAKDTIQYLNHLNNTTNLYRRCQVFYHQFLTSAISALFLASVHAPVRFSDICREEFYNALDLVKDLSAKSWVSQRLWRTISSLRNVAPRFGLNPEDDPQSTAALGMIGLARGHIDGSGGQSAFRKPSIPSRQPSHESNGGDATAPATAPNGARIQSEMSRIFEGYVGLHGHGVQFSGNEDHQQVGPTSTEMATPDSTGGLFTNDVTLFPHLREMF